MDDQFRRLTLHLARASTRRGFFASVLRTAFATGSGAAILFGAGRGAFAFVGCTFMANGSPSCGATGGGGETDFCANGDANGCWLELPVPYCTGCSGSQCPSGYHSFGNWSCCCGGTPSVCLDCGPTSAQITCICHYNPPATC